MPPRLWLAAVYVQWPTNIPATVEESYEIWIVGALYYATSISLRRLHDAR
jgi:hypothetical protein